MGKRKLKFEERREIRFEPMTNSQKDLQESLFSNALTVTTGPAGTGKTYTACTVAAQQLQWGVVEKIVLARANVPTGKTLGAIPGDLKEKLEPWMMPMLDVLRWALGDAQFSYYMSKKTIECIPLETVRGRSFPNSFIIVDESQQLDIGTIKAVTTRIGEGSKMCLMGDPAQTDLRGKSGFVTFQSLIESHSPPSMDTVTFSIEDIVRSSTCAELVKLFNKAGL